MKTQNIISKNRPTLNFNLSIIINKFVKNSNSYISELFNRFNFVQLTRSSNAFIRYISDINWRTIKKFNLKLSYIEKMIKNKEYWSNKDKKKLIALQKKKNSWKMISFL